MQRFLVVVVALVVGACAKPLEVASVTEIRPTNGGRGLDVHEQKRRGGQTGAPEFAGDQLLEVRSFADLGEGSQEVPGARCELSAAEYKAEFTTPAKVRVPLYRGQSSTLAVSCEKPGFKKRMITVGPVDVTRSQRYAAGSGSVIGLVTVAAVDALSDNSRNEWRYPLARVDLEKDTPATTASIR